MERDRNGRIGRLRYDPGSGKLLLRASRDKVVVIDPERLMRLGKRGYGGDPAMMSWDVTPSSCLRAMRAGPRGIAVRPRKGGSNWGGKREDPGRSEREEQGRALVERGVDKAASSCRLGSGWNDWSEGMRLLGKAAGATEARFAKEVSERQKALDSGS